MLVSNDGGSNNNGGGGERRSTMFNIIDLHSAVPGNHPIGWDTRAALVPLLNIIVVDGREGLYVSWNRHLNSGMVIKVNLLPFIIVLP
jgi:hypothetical protein